MSDTAPAVPFDMPPVSAGFDARGGWLIHALTQDLSPLGLHQAGGIVGNIGFESAALAVLQERHPLAGRGGFGWAQWTGPRRVAFEHWCTEHDLAPASDEANYRYLVEELRTSQAHSLEQLRKTATLEAAVFTFGFFFERPGGTTATHLPGYEDRLHYAQRALAGAVGLPAPVKPIADAAPSTADQLNHAELQQLQAPAASAPGPAKMSGSHGALIGSGLAVPLSQVLIWATHWPLAALDEYTATALAGLIVAAISFGGHLAGQSRQP